jgi:hypothetical protein
MKIKKDLTVQLFWSTMENLKAITLSNRHLKIILVQEVMDSHQMTIQLRIYNQNLKIEGGRRTSKSI